MDKESKTYKKEENVIVSAVKKALFLVFAIFSILALSIYIFVSSLIISIADRGSKIVNITGVSGMSSYEVFVKAANESAEKQGLATASSSTYMFPYRSMYDNYDIVVYVNQPNAPRSGKIHEGVDLLSGTVNKDTTTTAYSNTFDKMIIAPTRMVVIRRDASSGGMHFRIDDGTENEGLYYQFYHMIARNPNLKNGDIVEKGTPIGIEGNIDSPRSVHLHIECGTSQTDGNKNPFTFTENFMLQHQWPGSSGGKSLTDFMDSDEGKTVISQILKDYNTSAVTWQFDESITQFDTKDNLLESTSVKDVSSFKKAWSTQSNSEYSVMPFFIYPRQDIIKDSPNLKVTVVQGSHGNMSYGSGKPLISGWTQPKNYSNDEVDWETGKWIIQPK